MKKYLKPLLRLKRLHTNLILASMCLIQSFTANAQTSIPYSGGLITIDSLKAQRIQTDLLQLNTYKEMGKLKDSLLENYRSLYQQNKSQVREQNNVISILEKEKRTFKKRLFWSRCEIWGYRVVIITGTYFLLK
jgi:hypothetical protein